MSSGPAHRVCSAVEVFGFPEGHLGHLSEEQEEALREFKEKTKEQGLYDGPHGDQFGVYDDAQLLFVSLIHLRKVTN